MAKNEITYALEIPQGINVSVDHGIIKIKGKKGEATRTMYHPRYTITLQGQEIVLAAKRNTKRERRLLATCQAHIKNMFKGVTEGHVYKLKICSGHFPMNVSISGKEFVIKNFLGEKVPRTLSLQDDVSVKINGQEVIVEGISKERTSHVAAEIEQLTRVTNKDLRVFQDGIYITHKDGRAIK